MSQCTSERLGEEMIADAATAVDMSAEPEQRKNAIYRLASRIVLISDLNWDRINKIAAIAGIAGIPLAIISLLVAL